MTAPQFETRDRPQPILEGINYGTSCSVVLNRKRLLNCV
jgi:hypothetical protein